MYCPHLSGCVQQNIMFSGHLAEMTQLFEWVSGNDTFATDGWTFLYNGTSSIAYNTSKLLTAVSSQMSRYGGQTAAGGVPCEPDSIFIVCNNFPHLAFTLASSLSPGETC